MQPHPPSPPLPGSGWFNPNVMEEVNMMLWMCVLLIHITSPCVDSLLIECMVSPLWESATHWMHNYKAWRLFEPCYLKAKHKVYQLSQELIPLLVVTDHRSPVKTGGNCRRQELNEDAAPWEWCNGSDAHEPSSSQHPLLTSASTKLCDYQHILHKLHTNPLCAPASDKKNYKHQNLFPGCASASIVPLFFAPHNRFPRSVHVKMSRWCDNPCAAIHKST